MQKEEKETNEERRVGGRREGIGQRGVEEEFEQQPTMVTGRERSI